MKQSFRKRSAGLLLTLALALAALPSRALAAEFTLVELKDTDVTLDETVFSHTGQEIRPNVTVRVDEQLLTLDKDYTLEYADNIEAGTGRVIVTGIATASETLGYTGTVEVPFTIEPALTEITADHVAMEETKFTYTGSYIEPKITVTVEDKILLQDQDYTVRYHSNIGVGTAIAVVTGIEDAGYTGAVNLSFTIEKDAAVPDYQMIPLTKENVTMEGTKFTHTGKAIEPKITVTVEGKTLKLGQDYSLTYENNIAVGTGTAIVRGIATASETLGYTGEVKLSFTIEAAPKEEEPQPVEYTISKGDKATWYQESSKTLSFTVDGDHDRFAGLKVNGREVNEKYYTVKKGTVVTLKNSFLKQLEEGKYTISIRFDDGEAEGAFQVKKGLDSSNPETGDAIGLWIGLMGLSAVAAAGLLLGRKKFFA